MSAVSKIDEAEVLNRVLFLRLVAERAEIMNFPDPDEVADAMAQAMQRRRMGRTDLQLPEVTRQIPADILQLALRERGSPPYDELTSSRAARSRVVIVATFDRDGEG